MTRFPLLGKEIHNNVKKQVCLNPTIGLTCTVLALMFSIRIALSSMVPEMMVDV
jgi:hypothetical protein